MASFHDSVLFASGKTLSKPSWDEGAEMEGVNFGQKIVERIIVVRMPFHQIGSSFQIKNVPALIPDPLLVEDVLLPAETTSDDFAEMPNGQHLFV